jgi:uncharacterized LabA/DUF88 family protein
VRTNVYIDGFNLYYGAIKGGPHKWLNLEHFFRALRPSDQIQHIYYFTAMVDGPARQRQETYLRALSTLPTVTVIYGRHKIKQVKCKVHGCGHTGLREFNKYEEKRTDVNIAIQMLDDAYRNACDQFILVSGDADLVPGVNMVKLNFPEKQIIVYIPARSPIRGAAVELRASADRNKNLPLNLLKHAQFPSQVPDGAGGFIAKPAGW